MAGGSHRRCLIVTDSVSASWVSRASRLSDAETRWFILPLGVSAGQYIRSHGISLDGLPNLSAIDIIPYAERAHQSVKSFYLPLMFQLPRTPLWRGRTLLSELTTSQANLWWFLEVSEKSSLRGPILNQLYSVALVQAALREDEFDEIWLCVADRTLSKALKTLKPAPPIIDVYRSPRPSWRLWRETLFQRPFALRLLRDHIRYFFRAFRLHVVLCWTRIGLLPDDRSQPWMFFTRYPALWKRPFGTDAEDNMYAGLPEELKRRTSVCYGAWLHASVQEVFRHRRNIRQMFRSRNVLALNRMCHIGDLLRFLSIRRFLRLLHVERRLVSRIQVTFEGADVSLLIAEEIRRSLRSTELLNDELIVRAIARNIKRYQIQGIIHSSEFQPIEKALWYGAKGRARVVAFQHSTIGNNKLQYHFAPGEIAAALEHRTPSEDMPLPDFFLTAGRFPLEVMRQNGFPAERMAICGAVRYERLAAWIKGMPEVRALRQAYSIPTTDVVLLITLSLEYPDISIELVRSVLHALPVNSQNVQVLIKSHPQLPLDAQIAETLKTCGISVRSKILPSDAPLLDFMALADAIFLTSSSTAIEAAALGRTAIIYDNGSVFTVAPAVDVSRIGLVVRDDEDMKKAVGKVLIHHESLETLRTMARREVDEVFSHLDGTAVSQFVDFLQSHHLIPGCIDHDDALSMPKKMNE